MRLLLIASTLFLSLTAVSHAARPPVLMETFEDYKIEPRSGKDYSLEELAVFIEEAIVFGGWNPKVIEPGKVDAILTIRSHQATVTIDYGKDSFDIVYKDSINLGYSEGRVIKKSGGNYAMPNNNRKTEKPGNYIHRNYNRWVKELAMKIENYIKLK